jgi:5'-3' exonuclease
MRLHVVDGTYELFRAHFSKRPDQTDRDGRDVKATVGVVSSILALIEDPDEQVTHLAVAFDNPIRSFRNDLYAGYKTEEGVAAELLAQFDRVEEGVRAIGVTVWSMAQWEADDALATAAARWAGDVEQVRILTPDKDLGQCISGEKVVQVDRMRKKVIDEAGLLAARGIAPESIPDYLALVGDTADGIPGIKGFGEKTAAALLRAYVHLEAIPADARSWTVNVRGAAALAPLLAASRDEVLLYRKLATLVRDVPLPESLDDLRWRGVPRKEFVAWCDDLALSDQFRTRPSRYAAL